jgi:hypothetical protein
MYVVSGGLNNCTAIKFVFQHLIEIPCAIYRLAYDSETSYFD